MYKKELKTLPTVLVVQDDPTYTRVYSNLLDKLNITYKIAKTAKECIDYYIAGIENKKNFGLLLYDISMHPKESIEAIKKIRAYENENNLLRMSIFGVSSFEENGYDNESSAKDFDKLYEMLVFDDLENILNSYVKKLR